MSDLPRLPAFAGAEISRDYSAMQLDELITVYVARFRPQSQKHVFNRSGMVRALVWDDIGGDAVENRYVGLDEQAKLDMERESTQEELNANFDLFNTVV
jgi:hypothetical protein